MQYLFLNYPKCTTCKKAKKWLDDNNISYISRDIKENNPTKIEIEDFYNKSGLPLKKFFNSSGLVYKELALKDKLPTSTDDEMLTLLASNGMLVRRPLLISDNNVFIGFKQDDWSMILK